MELYGLFTPIIQPGDNLAEIILTAMVKKRLVPSTHDIFVIAETVVATSQNRIRELAKVEVTLPALKLSEQYELDASLAQLILEEADEILGGVPHVLLTIKDNTLMANAGIDRSNAPPGHVVLLPSQPTDEAWRIKTELENQTGQELGIIISDSRTQPLRLGTVGLAVAIAGIEPVKDFRGVPDLYGTPLRITRSAIADNLASAAQLLFGEANEQVPIVLIRGAPVTFTKERIQPESMTIARQDCLYMTIFKDYSDSVRI